MIISKEGYLFMKAHVGHKISMATGGSIQAIADRGYRHTKEVAIMCHTCDEDLIVFIDVDETQPLSDPPKEPSTKDRYDM